MHKSVVLGNAQIAINKITIRVTSQWDDNQTNLPQTKTIWSKIKRGRRARGLSGENVRGNSKVLMMLRPRESQINIGKKKTCLFTSKCDDSDDFIKFRLHLTEAVEQTCPVFSLFLSCFLVVVAAVVSRREKFVVSEKPHKWRLFAAAMTLWHQLPVTSSRDDSSRVRIQSGDKVTLSIRFK